MYAPYHLWRTFYGDKLMPRNLFSVFLGHFWLRRTASLPIAGEVSLPIFRYLLIRCRKGSPLIYQVQSVLYSFAFGHSFARPKQRPFSVVQAFHGPQFLISITFYRPIVPICPSVHRSYGSAESRQRSAAVLTACAPDHALRLREVTRFAAPSRLSRQLTVSVNKRKQCPVQQLTSTESGGQHTPLTADAP